MNIGSERHTESSEGKNAGQSQATDWSPLVETDESTFCFGDWISFVFFPSTATLWTFDWGDGIYVVRFYSVFVWFLSSMNDTIYQNILHD